MKILRKTGCILLIMLIIISLFSNVNAEEIKTTLNVINQSGEIKYFENDQGYISKSIVNSNSDTGEVTIQLKVSNTKKELEQNTDTEVFLVVDNSPSMDFVTKSGKTRKEIILNSASQLVSSIFKSSSNVKIGMVDFHGGGGGFFGESASISNAKLRLNLTSNEKEVLTAIDIQLKRDTESGTNIEAGLKVAQQNFSKNTKNKVIILLTDGIPNNDISGNNSGNDVTTSDSKLVQKNTKATLQEIKKSGIYTITLLTGMSNEDGNTDKNGTEYTGSSVEEELEAAKNVFGTEKEPTADKYYLVNSTNLNNVITKDIFRDVTEKIQNPISTVKIVDYFPTDIIENFTFEYDGKPSIGTTSEKIDTKTNTIEWNIGTLKGNEIAILKYKLKMKNMKNEKMLNKEMATNEKVILTYKDVNSKDYTVTLENSPKVKLTKVENLEDKGTLNNVKNQIDTSAKNNVKTQDNTIAKGVLPRTGISYFIIILLGIALIEGIYVYIKTRAYRDIK